MINGPTEEAQKGFATLKDVDKGTFVRFIEWAHRGFYTAAEFKSVEIEPPIESEGQNNHEVLESESSQQKGKKGKKIRKTLGNIEPAEVEPAKAEPAEDPWQQWGGQTRMDTAHDRKMELKEAFARRVRPSVFQPPSPRANKRPEECYTDVFLSHVQLYFFADEYIIQPLKALALNELHVTLANYTLYPERTGDIIGLLRYIHANTGEQREAVEDLRTMMAQYMGYEMDTLMNDEDFVNLMIEDGGPLLGDFVRMVGKRIS